MKQLLAFVCIAACIISCNTNSSPAMTTSIDSVAAAIAAKDSMVEKNKATALASEQAFNRRCHGRGQDAL